MVQSFRGLPSLLKICCWFATVALLASVVQVVLWAAGSDRNMFTAGGRGILLPLTLGVMLVMMMADPRSASDYGLSVGRAWRKQAGLGFLCGMGFYLAYLLMAWTAGAVTLDRPTFTAETVIAGCVGAVAGLFLAATQQLIFSGYLLSMMRDQFRWPIAVTGVALLFGLLSQFDRLDLPEGKRMFVSMSLISLLLSTLRLRTGGLPLSVGLLTGCIAVRRVVREATVFTAADNPELVNWFAPSNDPRQAPLFWASLSIASLVSGWSLWKYGERKPEAGVDHTFKQLIPFSNLNSLARLGLWIQQLLDARCQVGLKYLPRLAAIFTSSCVNTALALPERLLAPHLVRHDVPDPVFIVGVHRSGTTHLHNLLSLDGCYVTPRNSHVLNPDGMLTTRWLTILTCGPFMTWKRPMDGVALHIFSPQEEEFAIANTCPYTPYWSMSFPKQFARQERFIYPDRMTQRELGVWRKHYQLFMRKLTFWSRKQPLLKSPYNTARLSELSKMFPRARFIHIHRHPYDVYRSNMHLAREGFSMFQVQDPDPNDSYQTRFLKNYRDQIDTFYRDAGELPSGRVAEVCFEDLESDPIGQVRRLYAELDLEYGATFHRRLESYLNSISDYQKNAYDPLPHEQQQEIDAAMGVYLDQWGYRTGSTHRMAA